MVGNPRHQEEYKLQVGDRLKWEKAWEINLVPFFSSDQFQWLVLQRQGSYSNYHTHGKMVKGLSFPTARF